MNPNQALWEKGDLPDYYGPTMNAFEAAAKDGHADELERELNALFDRQSKSSTKDTTSIPATFLRVTVSV